MQTLDAYRKTTDAAEWSGGQYDGRIRVALLDDNSLGPRTRRALAHEVVHACLTSLGQWPAWLHEGLAQKLSGETLPPAAWHDIEEMVRAHQLPRLSNLHQDWSRMSTRHAAMAYAVALAAVELYLQNYHEYGLRNLINNPDRLPEITADLNRRLGL